MPRALCSWAATACLVVPATVRADLVINECHFDPDGADAGGEFVEFHNPGPGAVDLDGVEFQFCNGADGLWQNRWTAVGGRLESGSRFLLADLGWQGTAVPDTMVRLGLQNGPDAVRLVRDGRTLDLLGYGEPLPPDLREGTAAQPEAGLSLARRPDGRDTGDNARDFTAAAPTPGRENFRRWSLAVADMSAEPPSLPAVGRDVDITLRLLNDGWDDWPAGTVRWRTGTASGDLDWSGCGSGNEVELAWPVRPSTAGALDVGVAIVRPDGGGTSELDAGALQVGPDLLVLSEVMAAPGDGQGEWIELQAAGNCELSTYLVRDADAGWRGLPVLALAAGEMVVLAADRGALLAREAGRGGPGACQPTTVLELVDWPSLNNSAPEGRAWADRVLLADTAGRVVDHVTVGGPGGDAPAHRSWERVALRPPVAAAANWSVSTAPAGGTPGCPNSLTVPGGIPANLAVVPAVLDPAAGAGAAHLRFTVVAPAAGWRLGIYDLWGGGVRTFGDDGLGPGPRDLVWDGRDDAGVALPPGGYVVLLTILDAGHRVRGRDRVLVVVR